ncbi:MAG: PEGA domain-containing protein [Xanthobacteraceae bacterium]
MSRVIAVTACGFALAACSMSMPSFDFFRSSPPTEVLRIESEPPGADARIAEGQSCRTPCELTVPATGEVAVSFDLAGYQSQTIAVRSEAAPAASYAAAEPTTARMQPNPVYAELQPNVPPRAKKRSRPKPKKTVAKKAKEPPPEAAEPAAPPPQNPPPSSSPPPGNTGFPGSNYPWPPPPSGN